MYAFGTLWYLNNIFLCRNENKPHLGRMTNAGYYIGPRY